VGVWTQINTIRYLETRWLQQTRLSGAGRVSPNHNEIHALESFSDLVLQQPRFPTMTPMQALHAAGSIAGSGRSVFEGEAAAAGHPAHSKP